MENDLNLFEIKIPSLFLQIFLSQLFFENYSSSKIFISQLFFENYSFSNF